MRVGIYLGRHAGHGGGIGVYCRCFIQQCLKLIEDLKYERIEIVFYGDNKILTEELLFEMSYSNVLNAESRRIFDWGASKYFAVLPNAGRCRVLFRVLPSRVGHRFGLLFDQMVIPILCKLDEVNLLHCLSNVGMCFNSNMTQVITVHDLYQGWPPVESKGMIKKAVSFFYKAIFYRQFKIARRVITDAFCVSKEIQLRMKFPCENLSVISLGLDDQFAKTIIDKDWPKKFEKWLKEQKLAKGYSLIFASMDPRKNFKKAFSSWCQLSSESKKKGLVICISNKNAKSLVKEMIEKSDEDKGNIYLIEDILHYEIPLLFCGANVAILPTLAGRIWISCIRSFGL